jgi:hypothetical protein
LERVLYEVTCGFARFRQLKIKPISCIMDNHAKKGHLQALNEGLSHVNLKWLCFVHDYCCTDHAPTTHHPVGDDMAVDSWPTVVDSTGGGVRDQRVRTMERSSHANPDQECIFDA